jgi:hypothetical protein
MDANNKKILTIENTDYEYKDILWCLPKYLKVDHYGNIDEINLDKLTGSDYVLCISDLLDIETKEHGYELDSTDVFESLKRGIHRISKLRQHLNCKIIIVTKLPAKTLLEHFKKLMTENDSSMNILFGEDKLNLPRKLENARRIPFGTIYDNEQLRINIKPYFTTKGSDENIVFWKSDFSQEIKELCPKKILIIEDSERDYRDVEECLPKSFIFEHLEAMDEDSIVYLEEEDYVLCVCDLMLGIKPTAKGIPFDSDDFRNNFKEGINRISKLRTKLKCNLIIITKAPVRILSDFFKNPIAKTFAEAIFKEDSANLCRKLDTAKCLSHGLIYTNEETHIVIKPYLSKDSSNVEFDVWKNEFVRLVTSLCLPNNRSGA